MGMPINMILAIDAAEGIGDHSKSGMPWHFPDDLKRFKELTNGSICVMGRHTYEHMKHLYDDCTLPNRHCIVITSNPAAQEEVPHTTFLEMETALETILTVKNSGTYWKAIFIIGGAQVYKAFMERITFNNVYVTAIKGKYECTTHLYGFYVWLQESIHIGNLEFVDSIDRDEYRMLTYSRPTKLVT